MFEGAKVHLAQMSANDARGDYLSWLNDPEVTRYLETGRFPTDADQIEAYIRSANLSRHTLLLKIVERSTGKHVGNVKLGPIDWVHRRASIGILIGDKGSWGKGYGREAVSLVVDHAFDNLGLHKLTAGAHADHQASINLFTGLNFVLEARLKEHVYREGRFVDQVLLGLLREARKPRTPS